VKVNELIAILQELAAQGHGEDTVWVSERDISGFLNNGGVLDGAVHIEETDETHLYVDVD